MNEASLNISYSLLAGDCQENFDKEGFQMSV